MASQHRGFTLLEMMLAIVITAGLSVMTYQALQAATDSRAQIQTASNQINQLDRIWQLLANDLDHTSLRRWTDVYGQTRPAFSALFGDRLAQSDISLDADEQYLLQFTRTGLHNLLDRELSELGLVGYRLTTGENNKKILWRHSWRILDDTEGLEPRQQRLLSGIESMSLRYLKHNGDTLDESQWISGWPERNGESAPLPKAIEIDITVEGIGNIKRIFALSGEES